MGGNLMGWPTLLIILVVIILLFGAAKLPALAKSVGQSARVFKGEMKAMKDEDVQHADSSAADSADTGGSASGEPGAPDRSS